MLAHGALSSNKTARSFWLTPSCCQSAARSVFSGCAQTFVELLEDRLSDGGVRAAEDFRLRPVARSCSALGHDRAQGIVERLPAIGLPPDLDVGKQPEERSAPVGTAPRRRVVETFIAGSGEAFGK